MTAPLTEIEGKPLSAREAEVLQLLARGLSDEEIAAELVVSVNTVKTHNRRIFAKLCVRDRRQAVAAGYERGLLPLRAMELLHALWPAVQEIAAQAAVVESALARLRRLEPEAAALLGVMPR